MKLFNLFFILICYAFVMHAQAPQGISYQAVARNSAGNPISNQIISLRISVRLLTSSGAFVYRETHSVSTNSLGLFSINIGQGVVISGTFSLIDWNAGSHFLQIELDATGGSSYTDMGTQQLMSVPYALNAANGNWKKSGNDIVNENTGSIGIGTSSPVSSAQLDVSSTTKGLMPPRMTFAERNAIINPEDGLIVYCTDCKSGGELQIYGRSKWNNIIGSNSSEPFACIQTGAEINGKASNDQSGYSISFSSDGLRLAIGSPFNNGSVGHVRVFQWDGSNWIQWGTDIIGEAGGDQSGYSVSLSSDGYRLAVGAILNDGSGFNAGHVRVWQWSGSSWLLLGNDINGETTEDRSGCSVSLSSDGSRLAIGANLNDGNGTNSGHVRVWQWNGTSWNQLGADINGEAIDDQYGLSISLSSDGFRLAIGANGNDGNGIFSGHVRVWQWNGSNWIQLGADINGEAAFDNSGFSVSLSSDGSRLAIGAPYNDGSFTNAGHVRILEWNGSSWNQLGTDINGEAPEDNSGWSVSLSADGSRIAIGAIGNDANGGNAGHVRMYQWNGSNWIKMGTDIDGESAGNYSGHCVSLSPNGSRLAVGAIFNNGTGINSGHVRVYK